MLTEPVSVDYAKMRRFPRYKLDVPVRVVVRRPSKTVFIDGRGSELNEGGMAVIAGVELKAGDIVTVEFTPPYSGQPMSVRSVVRQRAGYRYGLEFLTVDADEQHAAMQIREVLRVMGCPIQ